MKPKIVERGPFHVIGLRERFEPATVKGIPDLWDRYIHREVQIPGQVGETHYGVTQDDTKDGKPGFFYTAGVEVKSLDRVPDGFAGFTVPGGTYAVFTHHGPITKFMDTCKLVW